MWKYPIIAKSTRRRTKYLASVACRTCMLFLKSASLYTATVATPNLCADRITRHAICHNEFVFEGSLEKYAIKITSPRFAIKILSNGFSIFLLEFFRFSMIVDTNLNENKCIFIK